MIHTPPRSPGSGFDVGDNAGRVVDWRIRAFDSEGVQTLIAQKSDRRGRTWTNVSKISGVRHDAMFKTTSGIRAGLYNPEAAYGIALGGTPNYYTTAELEMVYAGDPEVAPDDLNPFIRMQNVGVDGSRSAKLYGELIRDDLAQPPIIPEPTTCLTATLALAAMAIWIGHPPRVQRQL